MRLVDDVHARGPAAVPRSGGDRCLGGLVGGRLLVLLVGEEVLLDPVGEPGDTHPEQSYAAGGVQLGQQPAGDPGDLPAVVGGLGQGRGPADGGEVVQPHLDRDRAARDPCLAKPLGHLRRLAVQQRLQQALVDVVGLVGVLDADRLRLALGFHRTVVAGSRQGVEAGAVGLAQHANQLVLGEPFELLDRVYAEAAQALGGRRPHSRDHRHLHRAQQVLLHPGSDDDEAVGLVEVARDLGDELGGADADRPRDAAGGLVHPVLEVTSQGADAW